MTSVETYYDANTRRFLVIGGSGGALAIHRPLWAEGVTTPVAAAAHVNDILIRLAEHHLGRSPQQVVDLGCGVGGSVLHLARHWPRGRFAGVTISTVQRARAEEEATLRGLGTRCQFHRGDFTAPPERTIGQDWVPADLAIAIESHVHAKSAEAFLAGAKAFVRPGGLLLIVDDMLVRPEAALNRAERHWLDLFRNGWRLGHVPDRDGLVALADGQGFDRLEMQDLTPMIRLDRMRDRALHLVGPVAHRVGLNRWPMFGNMIGGDALTRLYKLGAMGYTCAAFRRRDGV